MKKNWIYITGSVLALTSCNILGSYVQTAATVTGVSSVTSLLPAGKAKSLPGVFEETSTQFNDPDLTLPKIKSMISRHNQPFKIVIYGDGPDYDIQRDELGNITRKFTHKQVWATYKNLKDGKFYYDEIHFTRQYQGIAFKCNMCHM